MRAVTPPQSAYDLLAALLSSTLSHADSEKFFLELVSRPLSTEIVLDCVKVLRKKMIPVTLSSDAVDTAGTGGSGLTTINTSSLTAFIVAAAGGKVAKHGNRSASGNCGCFDLLEELGVNIQLQPDQERRIFDRLGIVFLFAPSHHPALRFVAPLRKNHRKKTLFNLLGPLLNPANVRTQMIGTGSDSNATIIAETLQKLGSVGSLVVTGHDGLDEVTVTANTTVRRITEQGMETTEFSPALLSIPFAHPSQIVGGSAKENAALFHELAQGKGPEAMKNLMLVNAAHALTLTPLAKTTQEGFLIAQETVDSGAAYELFQSYRDLSNHV